MSVWAVLPGAAEDFTVATSSIEPRCNNFCDAEQHAALSVYDRQNSAKGFLNE
jgi:hypothetical protein